MNVPPVDYRFLDEPREAEEALRGLSSAGEIAVDLEADSLHSYREKVCLIQLSSPQENLIIDPLACSSALPALESLLIDRGIRKSIHGANYDVRLLKRDFGFEVLNIFDTMVAAQLGGCEKYGLAALLEKHFDIRLDKKYQQADWSARPLARELLDYAARDTAWLLPLRERLEEGLRRLGRLSWAEEDFLLLEKIEPSPPKSPSAWDIKGAGLLTPEQRAYLQRLVKIRDELARTRNRPPFKILSNRVLTAWVEKPPGRRRDVMESPGASKAFLALLADEVLEAFRRPLGPEEPMPPKAGELGPLTGAQKSTLRRLKAARAGMEDRLGLPPGLLVNSATLERLVRLEPGEVHPFFDEVLKNWQREIAGEELSAIVDGMHEPEPPAPGLP